MPQLEVSTYITQIFWLITTFLCFWLAMDKIIIPRISETIEARKRKYDEFILKAEEVNKKALNALQRYEETLAAAKANASEQISKNEAELKEFMRQEEEKITEQLKLKIAEKEDMLLHEKAETMDKIEEISRMTALTILQQLDIKSITLKDLESVEKEK